jgi:hypothetical protein
MGYLVLNKAAGGTKILAGTNPYIQVTKADQKQELLGIETFNITIESKTPILFSVGDSIDVFGRRYWINDPQNITIADTGDKYIYDIQMEGIQYRFINAVLFAMGISEYAPSTEVVYTANLLEALRLVVTCVNFNEGWEMFVLDEATVPETKRMTLSFSDTNCLSALQTICGKDFFNVLFKFIEQQDGTYKLRVGATVGENLPYSFTVGQKGGAYDIKRNKGGNSGVSFTRLFAYGSSENISNSYRGYSSRLRLPGTVPAGYTLPDGIELVNDTQRNLNYVQLIGATHKVSNIKTYSDIKPHRTGVVSGVDGSNVNRFFDTSMNFDINEKLPNGDTKYLLNGQAAKIHFNTGKLAGLEFDATYSHSRKSFTLVSYADERGQTFPDPKTTTFRVSEGDEYVILNINMPDLYIENAEKELLIAAVKDLQDSFSPANKYTVKIRELYLKKYETPGVQSNFFNVGDFVHIKNAAMGVDSNIQILSFTRSWLNPLNYTLELSDVVTISYMVQMLGAIEAINNVVSINKLDNPARTKRNWRVSEEIASKIETLRTDMVLVGKPEGQYDTNINFEYNYGGNRNRIISTSGALVHAIYTDGVQAGTWNVGASDNTLADSDGMKFVYIKAEVDSASAFIVFSDNEIGVDSVVGYYHFPYCILSSIINGLRTATKFKGRTQVIGDEISTGHIKGNGLDIDLNAGTVTGKVKIVTSSGAVKSVEQAIDEVEVDGRNFVTQLKRGLKLQENWLHIGEANVVAGKQYRITARIKPNQGTNIGVWVYDGFTFEGLNLPVWGDVGSYAIQSNLFTAGRTGTFGIYVVQYNGSQVDMDLDYIMLTKGTKYFDFQPSPEDVATDAQNRANLARIQAEAYSDGVVTEAEERAIAEAQALVDAVQVGGRNFYKNGDFSKGMEGIGDTFSSGTIREIISDPDFGNVFKFSANTRFTNIVNAGIKTGDLLTLSFYMKSDMPTLAAALGGISFDSGDNRLMSYQSMEVDAQWKRIVITQAAGANQVPNLNMYIYATQNDENAIYIANIQLEKGNKATTFKKADEDIAADILTAQNAADAANAEIGNITSDGVFDKAEKISKRQEWEIIAGEKVSLNNQAANFSIQGGAANLAYNSAFTTLANYLNAGATWVSPQIPFWISDSQLSVNTPIVPTTFRANYKAYYDAKIALMNAISTRAKQSGDGAQATANDALDEASNAYNEAANANFKVDNLQVGGENLIVNSNFTLEAGAETFAFKLLRGSESNIAVTPSPCLTNGKMYIFTAEKIEKLAGTATGVTLLLYDFVAKLAHTNNTLSFSASRQTRTLTIPSTGNWSLLLYAGLTGTTAGNTVNFTNLMLQEGNKATTYKPATEYLTKSIEGSTEITGGLALGNILGVKNQEGKVTAGMNGIETVASDIRFWAGATIPDIENAPFKVYEDGTIKVSNVNNGAEIVLDRQRLDTLPEVMQSLVPVDVDVSEYTEIDFNRQFYESNESYPQPGETLGGKLLTYNEKVFTISTHSLVTIGMSWRLIFRGILEPFAGQIKITNIHTGAIMYFNTGSKVVVQTSDYWHYSSPDLGEIEGAPLSIYLPGGTYRIRVEASVTMNNSRNTGEIEGDSWIISIQHKAAFQKTVVAPDGILSVKSENLFFYLAQDADYFLQLMGTLLFKSPDALKSIKLTNAGTEIKGAIDIPAGLGGGKVGSTGVISDKWGLSYSSSRNTSTTTIKHNVTDVKFTVNVIPKSSFTWYLSSITAASSPTANDGNIVIVTSTTNAVFDFVIVRTPY